MEIAHRQHWYNCLAGSFSVHWLHWSLCSPYAEDIILLSTITSKELHLRPETAKITMFEILNCATFVTDPEANLHANTRHIY